MAKVLVTGGVGFVGCHLIGRLLDRGHEIHVVDNLSRGRLDPDFAEVLQHPGVRFVEADLTVETPFAGFAPDYDYVYHLAAVVGVDHVRCRPDRVLYVNTVATLRLFEWLKDNCRGLRKVLFSSTSEVYAGTMKHYGVPVPTPEDVTLTLDDLQSPRTTYALSKIVGESICHTYGRKYDIPVTIVRYHNVYGPRMGFAHVIPELMIRAHKAKDALEVYSPDHTRAFCYVDDAVEGTIRLAEADAARGEVVHVGNGEDEITIRALAEKIVRLVHPGLSLRPLGATEGSPARRCPDTGKMDRLVGFKARVPLEEGLRRTWAWYKKHVDDVYE